MLYLKIAQLNLSNFKGVTGLTLPEKKTLDVSNKDTPAGEAETIEGDSDSVLSDSVTIMGRNGSGKTTIKEAIAFLISGRNSSGRTDNFIKKGAEACFVSARLFIAEDEGKGSVSELTIGRGIRAKQSNKRGEDQVKGYETTAQINGVEVKVSELETKISELVSPEDFHVLFNPLYFSLLNWDKRRELLFRAVPAVSEFYVADECGIDVAESLKTHSASDLIKAYKKEAKKANEKIGELTNKKEEAARSLPDENEIADAEREYEAIKEKLESVSETIDKRSADAAVSDELTEASQAYETEKQKRLKRLEDHLEELRGKKRSNLDRISKIEEEVTSLTKNREDLISEMAELESKDKELRERWEAWSGYEPTKDTNLSEACPTCGQKPASDKLSDLIQKKAEEKQKILEQTKNEGRSVNEALDDRRNKEKKVEAQIRYLNKEAEEVRSNAEAIEKEINSVIEQGSVQIIGVSEKEKEARERLEKLKAVDDNSKDEELAALKEKRLELRRELERTAATKAKRETLQNSRARVEEIERSIKLESDRYNEALRITEELEGVIVRRVNILEYELERVFSGDVPVSFMMFERKLNGELTETCRVMYQGREFDNLSNGEQLSIGYAITERLKLLLGSAVPSFVDNSEALTISLSEPVGQQFTAKVTEGNFQSINH